MSTVSDGESFQTFPTDTDRFLYKVSQKVYHDVLPLFHHYPASLTREVLPTITPRKINL